MGERGATHSLSNVVFVQSPDFLQLISNPELGPGSKFDVEDYRQQQTSVNHRGPDRGRTQLAASPHQGGAARSQPAFKGQRVRFPLLRGGRQEDTHPQEWETALQDCVGRQPVSTVHAKSSSTGPRL